MQCASRGYVITGDIIIVAYQLIIIENILLLQILIWSVKAGEEGRNVGGC